MKIAINKCYGGFSVSKEVFTELGIPWDEYGFLDNEVMGIDGGENYDAWRAHPKLIAAIEKIGEDKASGSLARVHVVDIPDGVEWEIHDYDGVETIREVHRSW